MVPGRFSHSVSLYFNWTVLWGVEEGSDRFLSIVRTHCLTEVGLRRFSKWKHGRPIDSSIYVRYRIARLYKLDCSIDGTVKHSQEVSRPNANHRLIEPT